MRVALPFASLLVLSACGSDDPSRPDAGAIDAGRVLEDASADDAGTRDASTMDAGATDAGAADAGASDAGEAGPPSIDASEPDAAPRDGSAPREDAATDATIEHEDAGLPRAGFGAISGTCGVLDDELTSEAPAWFVNAIDFGSDPYDAADYAKLTLGGREMIDAGNAGGSSLYSEVFSYELLARCEAAVLLKTETEIDYDTAGKITDLLVEIDGLKIGVSVVRAVGFPFDAPYTEQKAKDVLSGKLADILVSSANVAPADAWTKQILYVVAYAEGHVAALEAAYASLDAALKADTIVMVSVTGGDDAFLY